MSTRYTFYSSIILITIYLFISAENIKVFVTKIRHRILQPSNLGFFFWHVLLNCKKQTDKRLLMKGKGFTILHPPKYTVYPVGPNPPNFCTTKKNQLYGIYALLWTKTFQGKTIRMLCVSKSIKNQILLALWLDFSSKWKKTINDYQSKMLINISYLNILL